VETLTLPRLLGRAWGVVSALLGLAGAAIVVLLVVAVVRDLVTPSHPAPSPPRVPLRQHNLQSCLVDGRLIAQFILAEKIR
jgi:hypothetical protein